MNGYFVIKSKKRGRPKKSNPVGRPPAPKKRGRKPIHNPIGRPPKRSFSPGIKGSGTAGRPPVIIDKNGTKLTEFKQSEEYKAVAFLQKKGIKPDHILDVVKALTKQGAPQKKTLTLGKYNIKIIAMGDSHIGNINYKPNIIDLISKIAKKEEVDMIIHTGDILDGWYLNRNQELFEQNAIGVDQQISLAIKEFSKLPKSIPFYFITGNHTWNTYKRNAGIDIGIYFKNAMEKEGRIIEYLGNGEGDIRLSNEAIIKLLHPDGGASYALSYKTQKIADSFTGGEKPGILFVGHFHKAEYLFYRNIHIIQTGSMCGQTKFLRGRHIPVHIGFWLIEIWGKEKKPEIDRVKMEWFPYYEKKRKNKNNDITPLSS